MTQCYECMKQAGVDTDDMNQPSMQLKWKTYDFCNTATLNLYDLFFSFLAWLGSTKESVDHDTHRLDGISAVLTLAHRFTSTGGMNQATRMGSLSKSTQGPWPLSTLTSSYTMPTPYLEQRPESWPYTAYIRGEKGWPDYLFPVDGTRMREL